MEILLLMLPWFWIAAAAWILLRVVGRVAHPRAATAFAIVLVLVGVSDFFVTPKGTPPTWLVAWKVLCVLAAWGILLYLRTRPRNR